MYVFQGLVVICKLKMCFFQNKTFFFSFQFSDPDLSPDQSSPPLDIGVVEGGRCHGVVVWWDITLGDSVLTMDPWRYQWRDHWLQAVQLWNKPVVLNKGNL